MSISALASEWRDNTGKLGLFPPEIVVLMVKGMDNITMIRFLCANSIIRGLCFFEEIKERVEKIEEEVWIYKTFGLITPHLFSLYG